jgi:hypothetical protein
MARKRFMATNYSFHGHEDYHGHEMSGEATRQSRHGRLRQELQRRMEEAFVQGGWHLRGEPLEGEGDLLVEQGPRRYVIELKVMTREARRQDLFAMLADAFLRASVGARTLHAQPLAIVGAPLISDRMAGELAQYAERFLGQSAWGAIDAAGRFELHGWGLEGLQAEVGEWKPRLSQSELFSDLNQWMLKVMLSRRLPSEVLAAPKQPIRSASHLAHTANVSTPSASRFVTRFKAEGYLEEGRWLELVRVEDLLHRWRTSIRQPKDIPARWFLPQGESLRQLSRALERFRTSSVSGDVGTQSAFSLAMRGRRACLGLFAACEWLGYGFVHGAPTHLYLEDCTPELLECLGLTEAQPGETADVWVREPRFPEAVFRGAVLSRGVPAADTLQCWLDVAAHPVRGVEQAEQLFRHLLRPGLLQEGR